MRWRGPEAHFAILPQDRYSGTGYARQRRPQRFHVYTSARDMSWQTGDVVDGPLVPASACHKVISLKRHIEGAADERN